MTKRRLVVLLAAVFAVVIVAVGLMYSRFRIEPRDARAKVEITTLPAHAPSRVLNAKERLVVGYWKLEKATPRAPGDNPEETVEFRTDGTFIFRRRTATVKPYSIRGTYEIEGNLIISRDDAGGSSELLIDELTEDRFVKSYPDGNHRQVNEWSRLKELPRWE